MIQTQNDHTAEFLHNIDAWRIILIVFVVANHTFGIGVGDLAKGQMGFWELLITTTTRSAVPVLSVFSGYLFARYGGGGYFSLLYKKSKSLVLPFIMWNALPFTLVLAVNQIMVIWPDLLIQNVSKYWLVNNLTGFHGAPANAPLYFLRDLIVTTTLMLMIRRWLTNPWVYGVVLATLIVNYFTDLDDRIVIRNIIPLFFLMGMGLRWAPRIMTGLVRYNRALMVLAVSMILGLSSTGMAVMNNGVGYLIGSVILAMTVVAMAQTISMPAPMQRWGRDYSFTIFLSHWWILLPLFWMWNGIHGNNWWFAFGAIPIIVAAGVLLNHLIHCLPRGLVHLLLGSRVGKITR